MARSYKICTPFIPGLGGMQAKPSVDGDQLAAGERVGNVRVMPMSEVVAGFGGGAVALALPGTLTARAVFWTVKLWDNGRTLRVRFLDGDPAVQAKVESIAHEWESEANLKLKFVSSGASEIRVSFAEKGFSWSTVGTDALTVPASAATMNYGWLEPNTSLREYQRVVRHEFGHALGMIHEHQNPAASIPWDKPAVYAHYAQQGWSKADVDWNLFHVFDEATTNHSQFDSTSIMQYAVPDSLTVGSYAIGWNTTLSALDKEYMSRQYPQQQVGLQEVVPNGPRVDSDLTNGGEVDTYVFQVQKAATHIMTTQGPSDTVLSLYGPNDPGAVLAWDDDRGRGANARIVRKLLPGDYWLGVRHKDAAATGSYSVGVTTRKT
ncbi:M12 family metallopeptidase [Agrococcus sp. Ld7]|uniref:M12 family metallopeptidase n=1 Tax=Agrococcus sp. Ld7 TaxID=649148 RepID=UPI00386B34F5